MLKKFTLSILCGFLYFSIQAQDFEGGVLLGINTSQVGGDNLGGFNKAGLVIGVFVNKSIYKKLQLQMEMNYTQKGSKNPKMNDYNHKNYLMQDISSSYIEVPFLLQYTQSHKLKIEVGAMTAYLINGYYNDLNGEIPNEINPFISYDIGLLIGLNYKYSENISMNTRISNSIFPIGVEDYENQTIYNYSRKGKYNSVLNFTLYYHL